MVRGGTPKSKQWLKVIFFTVFVVISAMLVELVILDSMNKKNAYRTSTVLLNQVTNIIQSENNKRRDSVESLKEEYIVCANAISYIIDSNPECEYDVEELKKIAAYLSVDEIHLFDTEGTIYSGTNPEYYGYNFDHGEQMAYFKPMLNDRNVSMSQDLMPNTAEGKPRMYSIVWNKNGTRMVQVGVEPDRLFEILKGTEYKELINSIPVTDGVEIYIANELSGIVYASTEKRAYGESMKKLGIDVSDADESRVKRRDLHLNGYRTFCAYKKLNGLVITVTFSTSANVDIVSLIFFIMFIYLILAALAFLILMSKVFKVSDEKNRQFAVLSSVADVYYSMHLINLEDNSVVEYTAHDTVKEYGKIFSSADILMQKVMLASISTESLEEILEFSNVKTVADRMVGKKIISGEFIGMHLGWFRASFIAMEVDSNQRPLKVIFVTRSIDEEKRKEQKLLHYSNTDELTGCYNRRAYEEDIKKISLMDNFVYVSIDVNNLKVINDSLGHDAGDELIKGAASCMMQCFGSYGKIYRNGGDEFVAIIYADERRQKEIKQDFEESIADWCGNLVSSMTVSCGYVSSEEKRWSSILEIAKTADNRMYESKAAHYRRRGTDRRGMQVAFTTLSSLYSRILKINLTEGNYQIVKIDDDDSFESQQSAGITDWMHGFGFKGEVHPDELEEYLKKTDLNYLRNYFQQNKKSLSIFYRQKIGDEYEKVVMEIAPATDYTSENQTVYLYVKKLEE